jgi:hypothetical protein
MGRCRRLHDRRRQRDNRALSRNHSAWFGGRHITPRATRVHSMNIAGELLAVAAEREARQIDEKLFLESCATPPVAEPKTAGRRR